MDSLNTLIRLGTYLCYVDDLCLIRLSTAGIQCLLNMCADYAEQHSLLYNGSKPFSTCLKYVVINFERHVLFLGDVEIYFLSQGKYLGITINKKNRDQDIDKLMRKFYSNAYLV